MKKEHISSLRGLKVDINSIISDVEALKDNNTVQEISDELEEDYDNMSSKIQESDKGELNVQERETLDTIIDNLESALQDLNDAVVVIESLIE